MANSNELTAYKHLPKLKDDIMDLWLGLIRQNVQAAASHDKPVLKNDLPKFLDDLAHMLSPENFSNCSSHTRNVSHEHGEQRAQLGTYDLDQVILEYDLLMQATVEKLESADALTLQELKCIGHTFQVAIRVSATSFVKALREIHEENEIQLSLLVEEAQDYAIFMLDPNGRILTWNEGALRIKQYEAREVIGQYYGMLFREEDRNEGRPARNLQVARNQGRHQEQWWRQRKDGSLFWADISITAINRSGKHIGFSKVVRDLTDRKIAESEVIKARDAAEAANRFKTEFLANMSHELRTPLGVILGMSEIFHDPGISDDDKVHLSDVIKRNGEVLTRLIDDILDLSTIESGKIDIQIVDVPIRTAVADVVSFFEIQARDKGIPIVSDIQKEVPEYISTDAIRLRQILSSLIGNAVKFTSKGQVKISARLQTQSPIRLEFLVEDTGIGIPAGLRHRLFQFFSQLDGSLTRKFGGTGLGLILAKRIALELGGDVELVDSHENEGSIFKATIMDQSINVKLANVSLEATLGQGKTMVDISFLNGKKILCAEDNKDNQILIKKFLKKQNVFVEFADDGFEVIQKATTDDFDLVLMDIQMPLLNGNDATRILRARGYRRPIIALSAQAMQDEQERAIRAGCNEYVAKPINSEELFQKMAKLMSGVQLVQ